MKKHRRHCKGCFLSVKKDEIKDWCCRYSTTAEKARSICLQQGKPTQLRTK